MSEPTVIATRPTPGHPRPYEFPPFSRTSLANGLEVIVAPMAGRPLVSGLADRAQRRRRRSGRGWRGPRPGRAGAVRGDRAQYDAVALIEATERLGAGLHADAGWDASTVSVEVPVARLEPALELLAEVAAHPTFPPREVDRLREERLNDLLQARAEPRRRVEEAFIGTIYTTELALSPGRPAGSPRRSRRSTPSGSRRAWARGFDPARMTLILAGDLAGAAGGGPVAIAERLLGELDRRPGRHAGGPIDLGRGVRSRTPIRLLDRPGSVQTEIRVGHVGVAPADRRLRRPERDGRDPRAACSTRA